MAWRSFFVAHQPNGHSHKDRSRISCDAAVWHRGGLQRAKYFRFDVLTYRKRTDFPFLSRLITPPTKNLAL
jgi:hypothetical protein